MGIKRIVDTELWTDSLVEDFTPEDKYFWLYLLTNPYTKQLGIYKITKKQMAYQLGYDIETVSNLLKRFEEQYGIIRYIQDEVAIKNYLRHSIVKGGKPVEDCLKADIQAVKHKELIDWVKNNIDIDSLNVTVVKVFREYSEQVQSSELANDNDIDNDIDNDNDNDSIVATNRGRIVNENKTNNKRTRSEVNNPWSLIIGEEA